MCRLISRFVRAVSFIHVSELFWELVMIVFLMLFFMGFARLMSGIGKEGKLPLTMGAGLCGAMVAFMVSLSRIITYFVASEEYLSADSPIELCDFGAALVAIMFLLSCVHDLSPKEEPETAKKGRGSLFNCRTIRQPLYHRRGTGRSIHRERFQN